LKGHAEKLIKRYGDDNALQATHAIRRESDQQMMLFERALRDAQQEAERIRTEMINQCEHHKKLIEDRQKEID